MAGLSGVSTTGVGADVVTYLKEVAVYFNITIRVTSGFRSPEGQATAMFDNWAKLEHGKVYHKATLPETDRAKLEAYFVTANDAEAKATDREKAKTEFLKLAKAKVGTKSRHSSGRALDVSRTGIDTKVYKAITMYLQDVKEGKRTDIYHFESTAKVPAVDDAIKAKWQLIKEGKPKSHPPTAAHAIPCIC